MEKTVCELFAGVGGFRCGLNSIKTIEDLDKPEKWNTVWFSQWEPGKKAQWAHDCYLNHFGPSIDLAGESTTNIDINEVDKTHIPDHNLLVGGFPCQDYSVARSLNGAQGIEGKKGVLWWSIRDVIQAKNPPFILLENVDRLLKSPASQRGRDFGVILSCLQDEGYIVEWRVVNAADYGYVQRRRRTFIFAYNRETRFAKDLVANLENDIISISDVFNKSGFFAKAFPIKEIDEKHIKVPAVISQDVYEVSEHFSYLFENSGFMVNGIAYSVKTEPVDCEPTLLGDILETDKVDNKYFIPEERLYYTNLSVKSSDETESKLPESDRKTWQYLKGGKKILRKAANGHEYVYAEGPMPMFDEWNAPARTMLTSEGSFNRSTHITRDKLTGKPRILTPIETERIQGFPDNWTKECLVNDELVPMPERTRYFCMGNALVVNLIEQMEPVICELIEFE